MSIQDMEDLKQQYLDEMKTLINKKDYHNRKIDIEIKINELKGNFNGMSIEINKKKEMRQLEQVANLSTYPSRHFNFFCYDDDDDDDEESSIPLRDIIMSELPLCVAITPDSPIMDSLVMEDKHLDTISETESDEFIKSSVENLVQNPSESEDECECDVPDCDDSQTTFFNPLFDDSSSSNDESSHEEVIHIIDPLHHEFASELITIPPIPPRIVREHEEYSSLMREEIDIFSGSDDSIPSGIESDDFDSEGDSTIDVVEDIPVDVPNILAPPGSDHDVSSPSGDRNKIYDPGICIEVESTRFLTTLSPVIDTLLPFSSENEDKVFNHGVLASEEKSPPSSPHRGFKAFQFFSESPMLIHEEDIPILDVSFFHFYPP
ncbi:hypothetical protein Tco_0875799 [Tanacetum coccineum]|uniref:Uncharacterized protein n=1 Tax=Tanacetum coccineum TaxID=301880 RepID=A0ABQ5BRC4_9ASTR